MKRLAVLVFAALALAGCAREQPPVSDKVQQYYDDHVATSKLTLEASKELPVAAFIGDSYTAGAGATDASQGWVTGAGRLSGWQVRNFGRGGTGYGSSVEGDTARVACGMDRCPSYVEMIPEVVKANPAIVVVSGGRNEAGIPAKAEAAKIADFYAKLRAALPDAKIVAVSPLWDDAPKPAAIDYIASAVQGEAASVNAAYLDIGQPLAGMPGMMAADGTHPNDAGHAAIRTAFVQAAEKAGLLAG